MHVVPVKLVDPTSSEEKDWRDDKNTKKYQDLDEEYMYEAFGSKKTKTRKRKFKNEKEMLKRKRFEAELE